MLIAGGLPIRSGQVPRAEDPRDPPSLLLDIIRLFDLITQPSKI